MIDHPVHPGEILLEELLERGLTPSDFSQESGIDPDLLLNVCKRKAPVDEALATQIAKHLGTSVGLWLNLQRAYDESRNLGG